MRYNFMVLCSSLTLLSFSVLSFINEALPGVQFYYRRFLISKATCFLHKSFFKNQFSCWTFGETVVWVSCSSSCSFGITNIANKAVMTSLEAIEVPSLWTHTWSKTWKLRQWLKVCFLLHRPKFRSCYLIFLMFFLFEENCLRCVCADLSRVCNSWWSHPKQHLLFKFKCRFVLRNCVCCFYRGARSFPHV